MNKCKIFLIVAMVFASMSMFSQTRPLEIGIPLGLGFYWGDSEMNASGAHIERAYKMALSNTEGAEAFPAFESYGVAARYLFTRSWAVQLQGMRQRMRFMEVDSRVVNSKTNHTKYFYYNSMWNIDLQVEYNFIKYGGSSDVWTPYLSAGIGMSLHSKMAQYRWGAVSKEAWTHEHTSSYPLIRDVGVACYVPFGLGVKWRFHLDWQLKFALQYQMYVLGNPAGGTQKPYRAYTGEVLRDNDWKVDGEKENLVFDKNGEMQYRPEWELKYSELPKGFGAGHNIVASICVIYTLGVERTVTTIF